MCRTYIQVFDKQFRPSARIYFSLFLSAQNPLIFSSWRFIDILWLQFTSIAKCIVGASETKIALEFWWIWLFILRCGALSVKFCLDLNLDRCIWFWNNANVPIFSPLNLHGLHNIHVDFVFESEKFVCSRSCTGRRFFGICSTIGNWIFQTKREDFFFKLVLLMFFVLFLSEFSIYIYKTIVFVACV